ncbi:MAG: hypothetical protein ACXACI_01580 [Candidatus Hodarchaeales archaeon]
MDWHKLPFSHGIEVENHIVDEVGQVITGDTLVETWNVLFSNAGELLRAELKNAPDLIKKKVVEITTDEDVRRQDKSLAYHAITYRLGKLKVKTYAWGPDPNISQVTWLLELVTPPCEYLEELDWWIKTLYKASKLPEGFFLLPIGITPAETSFRSGLSCGEHHHLGIQENAVIQIYNCLRAFVPHLICLTANSPLLDFSPTGQAKISSNPQGYSRVIAKNCTRSLRLKLNTTQLGPNSTSYLPFLTKKATRSDFSTYVRKPPPDDKYVDIFPFSEHGTIELRFFDAIFSHSIRMAIVVILQALALKAQRFQEQKVEIPDVGAESLFENRRKAIELGLLGRFQVSENPAPNPGDPFWRFYLWDPETGQAHSKIYQACRSMLYFIKDEIIELECLPIVNRVLAFLWGTEEPEKLAPPFSLSEEVLRRAIKKSKSKADLIASFCFPGSSYLVKGTKLSPSAKEFLLTEPVEPVLVSLPPKKRITQLIPTMTAKKPKKKKPRKKKVRKELPPPDKVEERRMVPIKPSKPKKRKEKMKKERKKKDDRKERPSKVQERPVEEPTPLEEKRPLVSVSEKEREQAAIPIPDITVADRGLRDSTIAQAMKKRKEKRPIKAESLPVTEKELIEKADIHFVEPRPKKIQLNIPKKISTGMQFWIPTVEWAKKDLEDFEKGIFEVKATISGGDKREAFAGSWDSLRPLAKSPLITLPVKVDPTNIASDKAKLQVDIEATFEHQLIFKEALTRKIKVRTPVMRIAKVAYEQLHGHTKVSYFLESDAKAKGRLETRIVSPYLDQVLIEENVEFKEKQSTKLDREVYIPHSILQRSFWLITTIVGNDAQDTSHRRVSVPKSRLINFDVSVAPQGGKKDPYSKIDIEAQFKFRTGLLEPTIRVVYLDPVRGGEILAEKRIKGIVEHGNTVLVAKKKWKPPKGLVNAEIVIQVEDKFGLLQPNLLGSPKLVSLRPKG